VLAPLRLTAGVAYDALRYPVNFRAAPVSDETDTTDQWSPKAGIVWTPSAHTVVRAAYTRSLSGASIDQSAQIEPTQVAGFNQSFRSIFPEALGGANVAARFETWGASVEQRLGTGTYLALSGEILSSTLDRELGVFLIDFLQPANPWTLPWRLANEIDFQERNLVVSADQLLGREWSIGLSYRLRDSRVEDAYPTALRAQFLEGGFRPEQVLESTLHQILFRLIYNHPSGFFGQFNALHNIQSNRGHQPDQPGDPFWQLDAFAGYRFHGRTAELRLGILNLTDQDYRLSPLTLYQELPRERTFTAQLQINL